MATGVLLIGSTGTGKSTAIESLNPEETMVISISGKPLPFRGHKKKYTKMVLDIDNWNRAEGTYPKVLEKGNIYHVKDILGSWRVTKAVLEMCLKSKKYKNIIIDDFGYLIINEYLHKIRLNDRSWDRFEDIADHIQQIVSTINNDDSDKLVILTAHEEVDSFGYKKLKTIGKMLDEKICIEGLFSIVLFSEHTDEGYYFVTQADSSSGKSPRGMFEELRIQNDCQFVRDKILEYEE